MRTVGQPYLRCSSGHYFLVSKGAGPLDGWSSPGARTWADLYRRLGSDGEEVSVDRLESMQAPLDGMRRFVVIEFVVPKSVFDAVDVSMHMVGRQVDTRRHRSQAPVIPGDARSGSRLR